MHRYKCRDCGGNQYSSSAEKEKEPCVYCGGEVELMKELEEEPTDGSD